VTGKPKFSRSTLAFILNHETTDHSQGEVIPTLNDLRFFARMSPEERVVFNQEVGENEHLQFIWVNYTKPIEDQFEAVVKYIQKNKAGLFEQKHVEQAQEMMSRKAEVLRGFEEMLGPSVKPKANFLNAGLFTGLLGVIATFAACGAPNDTHPAIPDAGTDSGQGGDGGRDGGAGGIDAGTGGDGGTGGIDSGTGGVDGGSTGGVPVDIAPLPDDMGVPTYINSQLPQAFKSAAAIVSTVSLNNFFEHLPTDSGSWMWNYDMSGVVSGHARIKFTLIDQNITTELASTGSAFVGYIWPDVNTTLDIEILEVGAAEPSVFRVALTEGVWNRVVIS
jgi:hypothetical protein